MKIGIIADIHDHIQNLKNALTLLDETDELICCGDLCSPFIINCLGQNYSKPIHMVFGNNDGDLFRITTNAGNYKNISLYGELCEIEFDGKRFAINHFDTIGRALAASNQYDVVCFGHNHQLEISTVGQTLIINPGEVMGGLTGTSTCVIYDSLSHQPTKITI